MTTTSTFLEEPHRSPVNPNEFHSSLRDRLVRFKRATKAVNRLDMVKYSLVLALWERRLVPEFI
jgi:hypothetical protein